MKRSLFSLALIAVAALPLRAQEQIALPRVPHPANEGGNLSSCIIFGCNLHNELTRYQQVFDASLFGTSPVDINALTYEFYNSALLYWYEYGVGQYDFYFSVTPLGAGELSTGDLDANIGTSEQFFRSFVIGGTEDDPAPVPFDIGKLAYQPTVTIGGAAFTYDPSLGNLLLDVRIAQGGYLRQGCSGYQGEGCYWQNYPAGLASTASTLTSAVQVTNGLGYVSPAAATAISVAPEPASLVLLATGVFCLVFPARRRFD